MNATVTNQDIEQLLLEAGMHGDNATVAGCMTALGYEVDDMPCHIQEDPDPAVTHWTVGSGRGNRRQARDCCQAVIDEARAMAEED